MSALDVIRRVEMLGGRLVLDGKSLRLQAEQELPDQVVADVSEEKAAIMVALGAPIDTAIGSVLEEIRPELPPSLRKLTDDKLLIMVNWSIIAAWQKAAARLDVKSS